MHSRSAAVLSVVTAILAFAPASAVQAATLADANGPLAEHDGGANWPSYGRGFSENHFSPLREIDEHSVGRLGLAWSYDLPATSSVGATPLAVDGVLYVATGYSVLRAIDARSGTLLWQYDPKAPEVSGRKLRAGWGIRGIAWWDGRLITGTHDGRLIALDAKSGRLLWSVQTLEPGDGRYISGPPWVFNGKVVIGHAGSDYAGVRGYVTAYDARTGRQLWRFYTVPGDPSKRPENAALRRAVATWKGDWQRFGGGAGGTVWGPMAYDPKFNRLYLGTSNGLPWNAHIRGGGDNLYLASVVALDADTGRYAWHYQLNPGDTWDYDAVTDYELATLEIAGRPRPVMMLAAKNGFFYVIDRGTGKPLSAGKYVKVTWAERIDLATGRPVERPEARFADGEAVYVYPSQFGGHGAVPMAYSPLTRLAYIPATESGSIYADPDAGVANWKAQPGMVYNTGMGLGHKPPMWQPSSSSLIAWNPLTQSAAWSVPLAGTLNGGVTATAGNLVMQGQVTGQFSIYAADSGRKLWSFDAQAGIIGAPITYLVGDRQYVTVVAGWRGLGSSSGASPDWEYRLQPRRVLTFALDARAALPPPGPRSTALLDDPDFTVDPAKAGTGMMISMTHCILCHGFAFASGGTAPDLRKSPVALSAEAFAAVVRGGALVPQGMPQFEEFTDEQLEGLRHYIRAQARAALAAPK